MAKRVTKVVADDVVFRVHRLPKSLKLAAKAAKLAKGLTVRQFLDSVVVGEELPKLLGELQSVLGAKSGEKRSPARLPFSESSLASLKAASKSVGLPVSLLFEACLVRSSVVPVAKRRGRGRKG